MVTLTERTIMKSRSGVYSDTSENRRKHRVGQKYGAEKQPEDGEKTEKKEADPAKELEAVNKVIAAINEGKLNLPAAEVMKLSEKKQKLEAAKKQAEKINSGVKANEEKKNAEEAKETSKKINEAQKNDSLQSLNFELEQLEEKRSKALRDRFYISSKDTEGEELNRKEINDLSDKIDNLRKERDKRLKQKNKAADELASAREELQRHKDKKDSWIAKYGKNSYETRLQQIKDNVERLKNKERSEKEKRVDEKNSKKAAEMKERIKGKESEETSDGKSIQKRKVELLDKYHQDLEKMNKAHEQEQDRIMKELDDEVDNKKRKELWTSLKEKTNNHNEATNKLWKEYESNLDKLEKEEDTHYDKLSEKEKDDVNLKEETEVYTRVKFDDVPNSGKINLKKYLTDKVRKGVDEKWSSIKKIPTENLKKMEKGLVNDLNKNFEAIKKSQRAELLYSIMKVRGELESRGKETQKKE